MLRREPYRLFFPLGLAMGWLGVAHWLLHGLGLLADYRPVFHSIAQIQGFMMCFALGFLLTAIPRRTGTAPPNGLQLWLGAVAIVATVFCAWMQWFGVSQIFWLAVVVALIVFAVKRFRSAGATRRPPDGFVWIPLSLATGIAGSLLIAAYGILGSDEYYGLHELGRLLLLQGMFVGLVIGAGSMVLPLLTRGESSTDGTASPKGRLTRAGHVVAALLFAGSFWWEQSVDLQQGFAARAILLALLLTMVAGVWRLPSVPGWHRRLVWVSAWMLPAGYLLAAIFPAQKKAGLHVVFIGGLALMALSVGLHVTLAHGGYRRLVSGRPWQVPVYGGLILLAMVLRGLMEFDPNRFFLWLSASSGVFLAGTLAWLALALPRMWRESAE